MRHLIKHLITAAVLLVISGPVLALQTEVASGKTSTLFIKDGSLYCSGSLASGACGDGGDYVTPEEALSIANIYASKSGSFYSFYSPTYLGVDNVKTVDAVFWKSAFLTNDGKVFWMGYHNSAKTMVPTEIVELQDATDITLMGNGSADTNDHLLAIIGDKVYAYSFQYGDVVEVVGLPNNVVAIDADSTHALFLTDDGQLFASGDNTFGQLGVGHANTTSLYVAEQVVDINGVVLTGVQKISAGHNLSMAIVNGAPYTWGQNRNGALGIGSLDETITRNYAGLIENFTGGTVADVSTNGATLILTTSGDLWAMGWHNAIMGSAYNRSKVPTKLVAGDVTDLFINNGDTWFVRHDGEIKGWGGGIFGQHAHGSRLETHELTLVNPFEGGPAPVQCPIVEPEIIEVEVEVPGPIQYVDVETIVEVEVPGPTVYVDKIVEVPVEVPGPTVYVDVPGPTVYINRTIEVEVPVEVPGPTVYVDKIVEVPVEVLVEVEVEVEVEVPRDLSTMTEDELELLIKQAQAHLGSKAKNGWGYGDENHDHEGPKGR